MEKSNVVFPREITKFYHKTLAYVYIARNVLFYFIWISPFLFVESTKSQINTTFVPGEVSIVSNLSNGFRVTLRSTSAAGGRPNYVYQWQRSEQGMPYENYGTSFESIGSSFFNLNLIYITKTTTYRVICTDGDGNTVISNTVTIQIEPLTSGVASGEQNINIGVTPTNLSSTDATGGISEHGGALTPYYYQWQMSVDGGAFVDITGATNLNFSPGNLTATTSYRVKSTKGVVSVYSNIVTVNVFPPLISGVADVDVINNGANVFVSATTPTGGTGNFSYKWQRSVDGATFTDMEMTSLSFMTMLSETTSFRLITTDDGGGYVTSNISTAVIHPTLVPGAISPENINANYDNVAGTFNCSPPIGGNGTYSYQWQSSPNGYIWTDITGATTLSYTTPALKKSMFYQIVIRSATAIAYSNLAKVSVYPELLSGRISPMIRTIAANTDAGTISSDVPKGGNGSYSYQWQNSTDGVNWTNIPGATTLAYQPGVLTTESQYRLRVTSNGASVYTDICIIGIGDCGLLNNSFSTNYNYIVKSIAQNPGYDPLMLNYFNCEILQTVNYFDGLGRRIQTAEVKVSPSHHDIVEPISYDNLGRQNIQFIPYALTTELSGGSFKSNALTSQTSFYANPPIGVDSILHPYSVTIYETSSLGRVVEQGAPGIAWQPLITPADGSGHTVKSVYGTNLKNEVRLWELGDNGASGIGFYQSGTLYKTIGKDENWASGKAGTVEEYTDFQDRLILKRIWNRDPQSQAEYTIDTYYLYDDFGNLRYVVPPEYRDSIIVDTSDVFNEYIYSYRYDSKHRVLEKKIPGKGWEYFVYNHSNQPVLTQDNVQREKNEWTYIKYDGLGRVIETGIHRNSYMTRDIAQTAASSHASATGIHWEERGDIDPLISSGYIKYTNSSFPVSNLKPHTINYYDDYLFKDADKLEFAPGGIFNSTHTKGLLTGMLVYKDNGKDSLLTVNYYDDRARLIQSASENHLGGTDYVTNTYSFVGELLSTTRRHNASASGTETVITTANSYDHAGRLTSVKHQINAQDIVTLVQNQYNEIGQLKAKILGGNSVAVDGEHLVLNSDDNVSVGGSSSLVASGSILLQAGFHAPQGSVFSASILGPGGEGSLSTIKYTYNERGWLTSARSPYFSYSLNYDRPAGVAVAQYNGNISEQHWQHGDDSTKHFTYVYDGLNRLKDGNSVNGGMHEQLIYDDMGNITKLTRDGTAINYTYTGNRLTSLSGALTGSYLYDANGNATKDRMGTNLTYNHLNLPKTANRPQSGSSPAIAVQYLYDALGTKLRKTSTIGGTVTTRDYVGGIEYNKVGNGSSAIEMIHTEEGYLQRNASNNTYTYHYNLTDHLGNVRATLQQSTGDVIQKHDYYPFGKAKALVTSGINKYLYNGKEIQDELGGQYDYGARFYDAEIGRWNVVDPLAEKGRRWSPYTYAFDNPIRFIDPDGMWPIDPPTKKQQRVGAGVTAGGIIGGSLALGGAVAVGGTGTIIGAPIAWVGGGAIVVGGLIGGASVAAYDYFFEPKNTSLSSNSLSDSENSKSEVPSGDKHADPTDRELPRDKNGLPVRDPEAADAGPHSQIGKKSGRNGDYKQAREFDGEGNVVKDIDFTDHGRPKQHPDNPHQHRYRPNKTGGTPQRSKNAEPLNFDDWFKGLNK